MSLKEVKLRLPADDLQRLDKEAQFKGVARAELLRQWCCGTQLTRAST